jgi:predicted nucleic acid-binding protein
MTLTLILDSGGVSALAINSAKLREIKSRDYWPPMIPADVLVESLTGDHRRDFHTNRLLNQCVIRPVTEAVARHAAVLRYATRRYGGISAVDAIVAAIADHAGGGVVLTSDPRDLGELVKHTVHAVRVAAV